jgi:two-component system sensor histidine kinase/response regulator
MDRLMKSRILVVDEDEANLRVLELVVSSRYRQVQFVSDASEVEEIFNSFPPDLVALDVHMPHVDGFEPHGDLP